MREVRRESIGLCELKPDIGQQKDLRANGERIVLKKKDFTLPESIHDSITSLTLTMNSALATWSLLIDKGEGFAQRLSASDNKERFREYFLKMRQDYEAVVVMSKSIGELSRCVDTGSKRTADSGQMENHQRANINPPGTTRVSHAWNSGLK